MKPKLSIVFYLLSALAIVGLIALGIAAFTAFSKVAGVWQALAASVLIEAALVIEGIALIRRNWWAAGGVLVSLIVSGTYNYIQAEQAGKLSGITNGWQLLTLAIGPLSALLFLALTIGRELSQHEKRLAAWEAEQKENARKARERVLQDQEQTRQERIRREDAERQAAHDLELAKIEAETKAQIARIRAEERERAREDARNLRQETKDETKVSLDWRKIPDEDKKIIAGMTTLEICNAYQVSQRTAQNWRNWATEQTAAHVGDNGKVKEVSNG